MRATSSIVMLALALAPFAAAQEDNYARATSSDGQVWEAAIRGDSV
jgi:hypothetical protein